MSEKRFAVCPSCGDHHLVDKVVYSFEDLRREREFDQEFFPEEYCSVCKVELGIVDNVKSQ